MARTGQRKKDPAHRIALKLESNQLYDMPEMEMQLCVDNLPLSTIFILGNPITNDYFQLGLQFFF